VLLWPTGERGRRRKEKKKKKKKKKKNTHITIHKKFLSPHPQHIKARKKQSYSSIFSSIAIAPLAYFYFFLIFSLFVETFQHILKPLELIGGQQFLRQ
jgi:hypothetical protein